MITTVQTNMIATLYEELPIIVNYESYAVDGYAIAFDHTQPKFMQNVLDISVSKPAYIDSKWAGISFKGLGFN